jgi:hypothetical protein
MNNTPCRLWRQFVGPSNGSTAFADGVHGPHGSDISLIDLGPGIGATTLAWHFCQTVGNRVFGIHGRITPFQIIQSVVRWVAVLVVDVWQALRVGQVGQRNRPVNQHPRGLALGVQVNAQVRSTLGNWRLRKPPVAVGLDAAVVADHAGFWVRPHAAIFRDGIQAFKAGNIFHFSRPFCFGTRANVST